jgi:hypothetical protein
MRILAIMLVAALAAEKQGVTIREQAGGER